MSLTSTEYIGRRSASKHSSPTTPNSPEVALGENQIVQRDYETGHTEDTAYRPESFYGDRGPQNQSQASSEYSGRGRTMSIETYSSVATTVSPSYVHEAHAPDSPTLPAMTMANPKFLPTAPRALGIDTQNLGGASSSRSDGAALPVLHPEHGHYHGSSSTSISQTGRRTSSTRTPSSVLTASPNPFNLRGDLPDSLRKLVLDQGLSAQLDDGTRIDMPGDDVQVAKDILNAWNVFEGNLGGGISHEKAYLCMLSSKLPKDRLAEIWDGCQSIIEPPMPPRMSHSLFLEEFLVAIYLIQRELHIDMDTLQRLLTAKSPISSQHKSITSKILINGISVYCPSDVQGILRLFGVREGVMPHQAVLDRCLYISAAKGHRAPVVTFLDWGADINALNTTCNRRALHAACESGHEDVVRILLQRGASVTVKDEDGKTPLHLTAADGGEGIVRMLMQSGADLYAMDEEGDLPLHLAAEYGCSNTVTLFLRAKMKVDIPGAGKRSALMRTVANGHKRTARCLLDEGANVNLRDEQGWTALHCAVRNGNDTLTRMLLEEGANIHELTAGQQNAICLAVQYDLKALVRYLIENGAAIDGYGPNGMAPIHIAAMAGEEKILSILLELGASVNSYTKGSAINSQTALMVAIIQQHEGIVRILLNHPGIDLEKEDRNRSTALHYAVQKGNIFIVKMLLEKNPRLDDMNIDGKAPIDFAKDRDIKDLLKAAAKNARNPRKFSI
ncbi:Ankyrin-3 [Orbilia brochopaga]|nr:Ankyrin-3 [Drechslerella brochopaga]